jgi:hypothetical protein
MKVASVNNAQYSVQRIGGYGTAFWTTSNPPTVNANRWAAEQHIVKRQFDDRQLALYPTPICIFRF